MRRKSSINQKYLVVRGVQSRKSEKVLISEYESKSRSIITI